MFSGRLPQRQLCVLVLRLLLPNKNIGNLVVQKESGDPEYAFRLEPAGGPSLHAVRGFHEPAAPDPIYGPAGSNLQPKSFPDFFPLMGEGGTAKP